MREKWGVVGNVGWLSNVSAELSWGDDGGVLGVVGIEGSLLLRAARRSPEEDEELPEYEPL